jgi:hypothetical protein
MKRRRLVVVILAVPCLLSLDAARTHAFSDPLGIYVIVDKVVLEPDTASPERIQIWGAFVFASKQDRYSYDAPERGYLYFSCKAYQPSEVEVCRKEWADLKASAGTGQVLGFGSRSMPRPHLRKRDDKPSDPDEYPLAGFGMVKMRDRNTDYEPIRALKSLPREQR